MLFAQPATHCVDIVTEHQFSSSKQATRVKYAILGSLRQSRDAAIRRPVCVGLSLLFEDLIWHSVDRSMPVRGAVACAAIGALSPRGHGVPTLREALVTLRGSRKRRRHSIWQGHYHHRNEAVDTTPSDTDSSHPPQ
jgi:hypothetical protein